MLAVGGVRAVGCGRNRHVSAVSSIGRSCHGSVRAVFPWRGHASWKRVMRQAALVPRYPGDALYRQDDE